MKTITLALLAMLFVTTAPNCAAQPDFDDLRAVLDGRVELLDSLKPDFHSERSFNLVAGTAMARSGRHNEAAIHYRKAAEAGSEIAVRALAHHFTEREDHVAGYAWSYLAMQLVPDAAEMTIEDWRPRWEFQTAHLNARKLVDDEISAADRLVEQLIAELLPALQADSYNDEDLDRCMGDMLDRRSPPTYPRQLANAMQSGWSHVYLLIDANGDVSDVVPIVHTDDRFARATRNAVKKWRLKSPLTDDCESRLFAQTIDYSMGGNRS